MILELIPYAAALAAAVGLWVFAARRSAPPASSTAATSKDARQGGYREPPAAVDDSPCSSTAPEVARKMTTRQALEAWETRMRELGYDQTADVEVTYNPPTKPSRLTWGRGRDGVYRLYWKDADWSEARAVVVTDSQVHDGDCSDALAVLPRLYQACRAVCAERNSVVDSVVSHIAALEPPPRRAEPKTTQTKPDKTEEPQ